MATKPAKYPEWADGGSAVIVEPSGPKKLLGWIVEKPPFQFFNWLFNLQYQWVQWFDYVTDPTQSYSDPVANFAMALPIRNYFSAAAITGTLPAASTNGGAEFTVFNTNYGGSNTITIAVTGGDTISGGAGDTVAPGEVKTYVSNATAWFLKG